MGQFESFIGVNFWTALIVLLNTLTIFFVGKKFLFGPIMKMIEDRQKEIDDIYSDADSARNTAMALEEEYKQKLSSAVETGEQIVKDATLRGQLREEDILRQANEEATRIRNKAEADIAMEREKAIMDAKGEISDMALEIARKIIGRELKSDDQADLVDAFIDELGDQV